MVKIINSLSISDMRLLYHKKRIKVGLSLSCFMPGFFWPFYTYIIYTYISITPGSKIKTINCCDSFAKIHRIHLERYIHLRHPFWLDGLHIMLDFTVIIHFVTLNTCIWKGKDLTAKIQILASKCINRSVFWNDLLAVILLSSYIYQQSLILYTSKLIIHNRSFGLFITAQVNRF